MDTITITSKDFPCLIQDIILNQQYEDAFYVARNDEYGIIACGETIEELKEEIIQYIALDWSYLCIKKNFNQTSKPDSIYKQCLQNLEKIIDKSIYPGDEFVFHEVNNDVNIN